MLTGDMTLEISTQLDVSIDLKRGEITLREKDGGSAMISVNDVEAAQVADAITKLLNMRDAALATAGQEAA